MNQSKSDSLQVFERYVDEFPSAQSAVDAVPGWTCTLPADVPATAGSLPLWADDRIWWMLTELGSIEGARVLELGPLEGSHTYMLERAGAASIDAVEANRLAFLRCLVFKELTGLQHARFHLGNFEKFLKQDDLRYDLVVASGILYHLSDPLALLERLAEVTDALFLWTHYVSDAAMPADDRRRAAFRRTKETRSFQGIDVNLYPRGYLQAHRSVTFCGGLHDDHRWMERHDLLQVLEVLGFDDLRIAHEKPDHPNGPCFSILARRTPPTLAEGADPAN